MTNVTCGLSDSETGYGTNNGPYGLWVGVPYLKPLLNRSISII